MWSVDFCKDFFLTFIYQYIAFKTRKKAYIQSMGGYDFKKVIDIAENEGLVYLTELIRGVEYEYNHEHVDTLWELVREAPKRLAANRGEFIVQMIDEFQFLNSMIYRDKKLELLQDDTAGGYLSTAESKIAPLFVTGSWVGWLMYLLRMMLPARFKYKPLKNMPKDEAVEMVFKYSQFFEIPVTEETVYLIAEVSEGSPFYISSILRSEYGDKDLTTKEGLSRTLEFETLRDQGNIKATWMEYVNTAFNKVNDRNAKRIVLHLCKHKGKELTRKELLDDLQLDMPDEKLEEKLEALVKSDIINQGRTNFDYRCVGDNIFDKVFRGVYQKEIEHFEVGEIKKEYDRSLETFKKAYFRLQGKYNRQKGYFAEYLILEQLKYRARKKDKVLKSITRYLPGDFKFCDYSRVWRYDGSVEFGRSFNVDIFARSLKAGDYSIIGEVKSREVKKFSKEEAEAFAVKFEEVKRLEQIDRAVGFIFSRCGFTEEAEAYCRENGIACSEDERWVDE
ncbi:MAG: hypothetical protein GY950_26800 [bacterium]|nr:hypothetical protein [bacterium]